eukprot:gene17533-biopygen3862
MNAFPERDRYMRPAEVVLHAVSLVWAPQNAPQMLQIAKQCCTNALDPFEQAAHGAGVPVGQKCDFWVQIAIIHATTSDSYPATMDNKTRIPARMLAHRMSLAVFVAKS